MGRARTIDKGRLFHETEQLILSSGYAGFHFKALAGRLGVARSTIYNYYSKKEELLTDFMVHLLQQVVERIDQVSRQDDAIEGLIRLWGQYAYMHQMMQVMPYIDKKATKQVEKSAEKMAALLAEMRGKVKVILQREQQCGRIREDVHIDTMVGYVMASVQIPVRQHSEESWVEEVTLLVKGGLQN
jgi:AcrR family transcriptional regulator